MSILTTACATCGAAGSVHEDDAADYVTGEAFSVFRCPACDVAFTWPRPASMDAYYPSRYRRYARPVAALLRALYAVRVRRWASGRASGRALEVGCGAGWMLHALAHRGWQVLGLERTPEQAAFASGELGVPVMVGGIERLPELGSFDLIFLFHVLEHLDAPAAALRACAERLKPGGRLIVAVPNYASWQARYARGGWFHLDVPRHLYHFTPAALSRLLRQAGLSPLEVRFASWEHDPYGWVQSIENRLGLPPNALTRTLMGLVPTPPGRLLALALAAVLTVPAVLLAVASWIAGAGAIMEMSAVRGEVA
jgi:SAM-dependent methyltransferase